MLNTALDDVTTKLQTLMGLHTTRDPQTVTAPCVFVDIPSVAWTTLGAMTLEVPVYLVAPAPGDLAASTWLLDHTPDFLVALSATDAEPRPLTLGETTHPAVMATATITVRTQ